MRLHWTTNLFNPYTRIENGDNWGVYRRVARGKWQGRLYTNGSRVKIIHATTEREIRRLVRQWVLIPF